MTGKIIGLCVAKNEADIIEAMVRHNLAYLDRLYIVDNGSTDATQSILASLATEYADRLVWTIDDTAGHRQSDLLNGLITSISSVTHLDHFVLLDADEFIRADVQRFRSVLAESTSPIFLPWVAYAPMPGDNPEILNPICRITHRRQHPKSRIYKTTLPASLIGKARIGSGNHKLLGADLPKAAVFAGLELAHFPVRSVDQLSSKVLLGAWNIRLRGKQKPTEAWHWFELAEKILNGYKITPIDLQEVALRYSMGRKGLPVFDPLDSPAPTELLYTPASSDAFISSLLAFAESCVKELQRRKGDAVN